MWLCPILWCCTRLGTQVVQIIVGLLGPCDFMWVSDLSQLPKD